MRFTLSGSRPHQHQDAGGLAGAVGPEQAEHLALFYLQVEPVDDGGTVIPFGQLPRFDSKVLAHTLPPAEPQEDAYQAGDDDDDDANADPSPDGGCFHGDSDIERIRCGLHA
jgi:hypothetical protein